MFKFGQIEVMQKELKRQRQISTIFTIDMNNVGVSENVTCNKGKDHRYIIGYKVKKETITPLFIKTSKNIFIYGVSQYDKNSAQKMVFKVSKEKQWSSPYKKIWNKVESVVLTVVLKIDSVYRQVKNHHQSRTVANSSIIFK